MCRSVSGIDATNSANVACKYTFFIQADSGKAHLMFTQSSSFYILPVDFCNPLMAGNILCVGVNHHAIVGLDTLQRLVRWDDIQASSCAGHDGRWGLTRNL